MHDRAGNRALEPLDALGAAYRAHDEPLERLEIKPKRTELHVDLIAVGWVPFMVGEEGRPTAA